MTDPRTAWVIPVHNRRAVTLACLRRMQADGVLTWSRVYVIDDGSTDGTGAAVRAEFPQTTVLEGDGNLWWTGAVELGMRAAHADGAALICWLNDDTAPAPQAWKRICGSARSSDAIVTGQCFLPGGNHLVYGGLRRRSLSLRLHRAEGDALVPVDATCGNFVCIPRVVVDRIGYPDAAGLPHAFGDTDFTLRARAAGIAVLVDPGARAEATPNALHNYASWLLSDITIAEIWQSLARKQTYAYAPAHARFLARHFGVAGACYWVWTVAKRVPISIIRLIVPQPWLRKLWGSRSSAWQEELALRASRPGTAPGQSDSS